MISLLIFENKPIWEQLELEEKLLRQDTRNWVIINHGSPKAIVMGIGAKPEEVCDIAKVKQDNIPLLQRFTGGGTVIIDEETLFVTFIFQKETVPIQLYPKPILEWTFSQIKQALPILSLQGNDFALGNQKVAGNAQYIRKDRWLHHTSFLWDFDPANMSYLLHPPKEPAYRKGRPHTDFLTKLAPHASKEEFIQNLLVTLSSKFYINHNQLI